MSRYTATVSAPFESVKMQFRRRQQMGCDAAWNLFSFSGLLSKAQCALISAALLETPSLHQHISDHASLQLADFLILLTNSFLWLSFCTFVKYTMLPTLNLFSGIWPAGLDFDTFGLWCVINVRFLIRMWHSDFFSYPFQQGPLRSCKKF